MADFDEPGADASDDEPESAGGLGGQPAIDAARALAQRSAVRAVRTLLGVMRGAGRGAQYQVAAARAVLQFAEGQAQAADAKPAEPVTPADLELMKRFLEQRGG